MVVIGILSVISSALVALGTILVNFFGAERQRKHEAGLQFEGRAWERKSDALFAVIERCRRLIDGKDITDENRDSVAISFSLTLDKLLDVQSTVEALASSRCRDELATLIKMLKDGGVLARAGKDYFKAMESWVNASSESSGLQGYYKTKQAEFKAKAGASFAPDITALCNQAEEVIDAARESVRRAAD